MDQFVRRRCNAPPPSHHLNRSRSIGDVVRNRRSRVRYSIEQGGRDGRTTAPAREGVVPCRPTSRAGILSFSLPSESPTSPSRKYGNQCGTAAWRYHRQIPKCISRRWVRKRLGSYLAPNHAVRTCSGMEKC